MDQKKNDGQGTAPLTETLPTDCRSVVETADEIQRKTESDAQRALDEIGYGRFNYKVIAVAGLMYMNVAFSITSVGFILPSAACDFDMNTIDKGRLSSAPILGMVVGSFIWGCIADTSGRRLALLTCLFLQALFECAASIVSDYWSFLALKFGNGLAQSGQMTILYTYLGEFQPTTFREKALSFMEISWVLGVILAPVLAWIIIPLDIEVIYGSFSFKSWNLFVVLCALPPFLVGCALLGLPETPKYLAATGRRGELRDVLTSMYCKNTGNAIEEYIDKLDRAGIKYFADRANGYANDVLEIGPVKRSRTIDAFRVFFITLYQQTRMLVKQPYIGRTTIACVGSYCILASIYTLMLWFPELFQRFADFEQKHPGEKTSVCIVSRSISQPPGDNGTIANRSLSKMGTTDLSKANECNSTIETEVYLHTLLLAFACVPVAVIFPLSVSRLGFRFYLVLTTLGSCAVTIALIFVTSSTQNLILSCLYEGLISISATVISCVVVELFPTSLRVTVAALSSILGRVGALIGNTMFGYLIDNHCHLLISIVAAQLLLAGVLGLFLPKDKQAKSRQHAKKKSDIPDIERYSHTDKYTPTQNEFSLSPKKH